MKKFIRWWACLGLCLGLLACGALAAESDITVQLDGQSLAFTDAVPQVKDQRTFLPFRAVFEAMGAEVNNDGSVITAVRGDKTLTMTVGSAEATVTQQGVTTSISMDVAPYVDASTWRTYVPVRFAAQAFDCAVGWDGAANTAVIVDTEKLVKNAMDGKSYTYLEQLANLGEKYNKGIWNMDASFDMDMTMLTAPMMSMDGAIKGVAQDNDKLDMTMNMKMDIDGLLAMTSAMGAEQPSQEALAQFEALKTKGMDVSVRGDITTGKLYLNMDMSALAGTTENIPTADTWYELDMAALMAQAGMNWSDLMAMSENANTLDMLASALATTQPNDAANGYNDLKKSFDDLFSAFADQSFTRRDGAYLAKYTFAQDDANMTMLLTLTMNGDQVAAYAMAVTAEGGNEADGSLLTMAMNVNMNADGNMTAKVEANMGAIAMNMAMEGSYAPGSAAPAVTPPAGAKVVPFTDLAGQSGDLGIIGGQDGPTSIFVSGPAA